MIRVFNVLFLFFTSGFAFSQAYIDPRLSSGKEKYDIVVVLKNQANLALVKSLHGKEAKASFVYKSLLETALETQKDLTRFLDTHHRPYRSYYIVNMIALSAEKAFIDQLATFPEVDKILEDGRFQMTPVVEERNEGQRTIEWGINMIQASQVWTLGYKGQGVIVGGQDTGYEWNHPALKNKYKGWNGSVANHDYNWHDAIHTSTGNPCGNDSPSPCDDHTHGTHTMGTMVGDDGAGNQIGVAPDAKWIGCRNMDQGDGTLTTYVECFEWFLAPYPVGGSPSNGDPSQSPHVINNSWGCPASEGCNTSNFSIMELALNNLRSAGTVIVVSAGNSGPLCNTVNDPPAIFQNSFSVGSTTSADVISGFSSHGPVTIDGSNRLKPNVSAPGSSVRSSVIGGGYNTFSGTSMAGPHVAGTVALLISANPELAGEVEEIESIIERTCMPKNADVICGGVPVSAVPNNTYGFGRINAFEAIMKGSIPLIKVDQFGYRSNDEKIAVLSNPINGINSNGSYTPSATILLKNAANNTTVFSGAPQIWDGGNTHSQSGDKAWWFDFTSYTTPGTYYISDGNVRSEHFVINDNVYNEVIKTAFKTFYYQRCGVTKSAPYAQMGFTDGVCHAQDVNCRSISDPGNTSLYRNMSGGWHDAGDYNKYVNFTYATLIDLLNAYEFNAEAWSDQMDLPESNNNIPDLLDEVKVELDWLLKMQNPDGSVNCIVGVQNFASASPPSADNAVRYYGPATTSATLTTSAIFAYASRQFKKINDAGMQSYAALLEDKAKLAWTWADANPSITYNNSEIIAAGEQEVSMDERNFRKLVAAIYMYALTGGSNYKTYVESNYTSAHMMLWSFVYPFENPMEQSLMFYTTLPGVNVTVANNIRTTYKNAMDTNTDNYPAFLTKKDAYRAYLTDANHTWGSNGFKTNMGNLYLTYMHYNLDTAINVNLKKAMSGYLHYIHGVNPLGRTYLTNMASKGADHSCSTIYHGWFTDGSPLWDDVRNATYGPAPGFLPGGVNPSWSLDACCASTCASNALCMNLSPPSGQPIQKSFREWNTGWPQNSWEITENSIYVQASYLCLLSAMTNLADTINQPGRLAIIDKSDLKFDMVQNSVVLVSPNNTKYRIGVDNAGNLSTTLTSTILPNSSRIQNNSLMVKSPLKGIVLQSPNGSWWKISMANNGSLQVYTTTIPVTAVRQVSGDVLIENNNRVLVLKDLFGVCYAISVSNSGQLWSEAVSCGGQ